MNKDTLRDTTFSRKIGQQHKVQKNSKQSSKPSSPNRNSKDAERLYNVSVGTFSDRLLKASRSRVTNKIPVSKIPLNYWMTSSSSINDERKGQQTPITASSSPTNDSSPQDEPQGKIPKTFEGVKGITSRLHQSKDNSSNDTSKDTKSSNSKNALGRKPKVSNWKKDVEFSHNQAQGKLLNKPVNVKDRFKNDPNEGANLHESKFLEEKIYGKRLESDNMARCTLTKSKALKTTAAIKKQSPKSSFACRSRSEKRLLERVNVNAYSKHKISKRSKSSCKLEEKPWGIEKCLTRFFKQKKLSFALSSQKCITFKKRIPNEKKPKYYKQFRKALKEMNKIKIVGRLYYCKSCIKIVKLSPNESTICGSPKCGKNLIFPQGLLWDTKGTVVKKHRSKELNSKFERMFCNLKNALRAFRHNYIP